MNGPELRTLLASVTTTLEDGADEFRRLDAAVGDGDLGVTVAAGASAVRAMLAEADADLAVADLLRSAAKEIAKANPSTMSALLAGGLLRAAKEVGDDPVDLAGGVRAGRAVFDSISTKGKSSLGDKTILDAIGPSLDALEDAVARELPTPEALEAAIDGARAGVEETAPLASKKGRARWVGERGHGQPDPGAVLYLRFLEAWRNALTN
jgi:phosphoenolpyruvate---glycerone phosphotransferase subunit DhaL